MKLHRRNTACLLLIFILDALVVSRVHAAGTPRGDALPAGADSLDSSESGSLRDRLSMCSFTTVGEPIGSRMRSTTIGVPIGLPMSSYAHSPSTMIGLPCWCNDGTLSNGRMCYRCAGTGSVVHDVPPPPPRAPVAASSQDGLNPQDQKRVDDRLKLPSRNAVVTLSTGSIYRLTWVPTPSASGPRASYRTETFADMNRHSRQNLIKKMGDLEKASGGGRIRVRVGNGANVLVKRLSSELNLM